MLNIAWYPRSFSCLTLKTILLVLKLPLSFFDTNDGSIHPSMYCKISRFKLDTSLPQERNQQLMPDFTTGA